MAPRFRFPDWLINGEDDGEARRERERDRDVRSLSLSLERDDLIGSRSGDAAFSFRSPGSRGNAAVSDRERRGEEGGGRSIGPGLKRRTENEKRL